MNIYDKLKYISNTPLHEDLIKLLLVAKEDIRSGNFLKATVLLNTIEKVAISRGLEVASPDDLKMDEWRVGVYIDERV